MFEKLLDNRLRKILEEPGESRLSENQYGFRSGRSIIDAIQEVCNTADECPKRRKTGMIMIDIKNAFNSAPWAKILDAIDDKNIPQYLCKTLDSYLSDRNITYQNPWGITIEKRISCGVPQGSVLGPTLWNILYDGLLGSRLPVGTKFLAFADDVAIVATARDTMQLKALLETAASRAIQWLSDIGLQIAPQKTEALVLTRRRHHNELVVDISGTTIKNSPYAKYLGVILDQKLSFRTHAISQSEKANKMIQNISKILPNISAAKHRKRLLLSNAVHSIILYGVPIWAHRMSRQGWTVLSRVQRRIALRVASAYRTVSGDALLVVTGIPPIELQAQLRKSAYDHRNEEERDTSRTRATHDLMATWQEQWNTSNKGRWTHSLISDINAWYSRKHGLIDFHMTQALTGHGCFAAYLKKYGKLTSKECWYCGHNIDDAYHTVFQCDAWSARRIRLENSLHDVFHPRNNDKKHAGVQRKMGICRHLHQ